MPISPPARLLAAAALVLLPVAAAALELRSVRVDGVADEAMRDDIADALSLQRLNPARRANLSESRLSWLLRQTPDEARRALEPYGYYTPSIETRVEREGEQVAVVVEVDPGEPVRVRGRELSLTGPASEDSALMRRLQRLRPREGERFDHGTYEDGKAGIDRALARTGYFDAARTAHRVEVNRAERAADITLAWTSGERYRLGVARFSGHPFREGLLAKLVPWEPGEPYDQARLLELHASLAGLDYFDAIDITADPATADDVRRIPVDVALTPAKRSIYSAGVRFGTDSGLGVTGGLERRWVNDRGHKLRTQLALAERRSDLSAQYRIPAFAWLDGWYTLGASAREEQVDLIDSQLVEVIGSRSGRLGDWTLTAALNLRRERYLDPFGGFQRTYSSLAFPSLLAQYAVSDDLLNPRRAHGLTVELRGGSTGFGSDIDFLQLRAEGRWIRAFGRRNRLLLRGEAGTTLGDDFERFPPSLRFYAGGDRSVRGYGWREIGETVVDPQGRDVVVGGRHLLVVSAEFERMFNRTWGGAVFVDAGDAFDDTFDAQPGAGIGLRWRSPVGPVRLDVAHGFGGDARQTVRLHLNIGPEL